MGLDVTATVNIEGVAFGYEQAEQAAMAELEDLPDLV